MEDNECQSVSFTEVLTIIDTRHVTCESDSRRHVLGETRVIEHISRRNGSMIESSLSNAGSNAQR